MFFGARRYTPPRTSLTIMVGSVFFPISIPILRPFASSTTQSPFNHPFPKVPNSMIKARILDYEPFLIPREKFLRFLELTGNDSESEAPDPHTPTAKSPNNLPPLDWATMRSSFQIRYGKVYRISPLVSPG